MKMKRSLEPQWGYSKGGKQQFYQQQYYLLFPIAVMVNGIDEAILRTILHRQQ